MYSPTHYVNAINSFVLPFLQRLLTDRLEAFTNDQHGEASFSELAAILQQYCYN